jgi:FdhD protein
MKVWTYNNGRWDESPNEIIGEQPVSLTVNNEPWLTFMCTPNDLDALAVGFLYNEEIIQSIEEVASVRVCQRMDNIDLWLAHSVTKPTQWTRTSGCSGGETSVNERKGTVRARAHPNGVMLMAENVTSLVGQLFEAQRLYKKSGGVHTSALSDGEKLLCVAEDIGRHNTLDKLAGRCLLEKLDPERRIILTTGRVSSEMIQKASRIGASVVISRTSPTSLSVRLAGEMGITLVGYAHRDHFKLYTHKERILKIDSTEKLTVRQNDQ